MKGTILVTWVGDVGGSAAAAAAVACADPDPSCAGLLVDMASDRAPHPGLLSTTAARALEERLAAHLPVARVAARGRLCHLALSPGPDALEAVAAAVAIGRDSLVALHVPPRELHVLLDSGVARPAGALLCADLSRDRALTALAVRALHERGLRVAILKRPLGWLTARRALAGAAPSEGALPQPVLRRLLDRDEGLAQELPAERAFGDPASGGLDRRARG